MNTEEILSNGDMIITVKYGKHAGAMVVTKEMIRAIKENNTNVEKIICIQIPRIVEAVMEEEIK